MSKESAGICIEGTSEGELLKCLQQVQEERGYLSRESLVEVARKFCVPLSEVYGVATFYSFLSTKPLGRNIIRICKSVPCFLKDSRIVIETVKKELGIGPGESTPDGRFSFELTNCIGACDKAPAMMINHDVHGELTPESIARILQQYQ